MNNDFCPYYSSKNFLNAERAQRMVTGHIYVSIQNQHWDEIIFTLNANSEKILTDPGAGTSTDVFGIHQNSDSFSL